MKPYVILFENPFNFDTINETQEWLQERIREEDWLYDWPTDFKPDGTVGSLGSAGLQLTPRDADEGNKLPGVIGFMEDKLGEEFGASTREDQEHG